MWLNRSLNKNVKVYKKTIQNKKSVYYFKAEYVRFKCKNTDVI